MAKKRERRDEAEDVDPDKVLFVRASKELIDRIDEYLATLRLRTPGAKLYRADAVRTLVESGLDSEMSMNPNEIVFLISQAIRLVATKFSLDTELYTDTELLEQIQGQQPQVHEALREFVDSLVAWYRCHQQIARLNKQGRMSPSEQRELMTLIQRKDRARVRLRGLLPG